MSEANGNSIHSLVGLSGFRCIVADPPWKQGMSGTWKKHSAATRLPYPTMTLDEIKALPVAECAADGCHLWLWTTNAFLRDGFDVMESWGFKYLAPIHWVKPSGMGNWFVHRTQTILFGYRKPCRMGDGRYSPNILQTGLPPRHSEKPEESYALIESVSPGPYLELFARRPRLNWTVWGNEVEEQR